jgi:RNA polymerase sigma-70 factor (ECF subfamily)
MSEPLRRPLTDSEFTERLQESLPRLRGYARRLCRRDDFAEDLVQEAACKAWEARERFVAGTSFVAWTFTILRNHFLSGVRRTRWTGPMPHAGFEAETAATQLPHLELREVMEQIEDLPPQQRVALLMVGIGVSYENAAKAMKCEVGTVKSRVGRARAALSSALSPDPGP